MTVKIANEAVGNGMESHLIIDREDTTIYADSYLKNAMKVIEGAFALVPEMPRREDVEARIRGFKATPPITGGYPVHRKFQRKPIEQKD